MFDIFSYTFVQMAIGCVLVLAGIHAYLGFHVVSRGVIFVDLALAQMAALGAVLCVALDIENETIHYVLSLVFTFIGAMLITVARTRDDRVPQEAFIGILFAASTAGAVLLLAREPSGTEELQHMLSGSLLTVQSGELIQIALLYAVIGLFHFIFRDRFFTISQDREAAVAKGWNVTLWDFMFYASFALVVTSSVHVAGVMLVFALLVIPPVTALLLTRGVGSRLALGWGVAAAGALLGVASSVAWDLPAGPSIIACLTALLVIVILYSRMFRGS